MNAALQSEGEALKVSFKDLEELREKIARVNSWKTQANAFLDHQTIR